jgi:hypothetical protein
MEKIDNKSITLLGFIDSYINSAKHLRIITEFISKWALEWLLIRVPEDSEINIITCNLTPDMYNVIDSIFVGHSNSIIIEDFLKNNKLKIGINTGIKNKIWLFNLENKSNKLLSIQGNSNLTEQGLWRKTGEQNEWSFEKKDFENNELEWDYIKSNAFWISSKTWHNVNNPESLFKYNNCKNPMPKLENILFNSKKQNISISKIQEIVSDYFKINLREMIGRNKDRKHVLARQIGMYFSSELTETTITKIGLEFNRDHSTVLYAKSKVDKLINENPAYTRLIGNIRNIIINEIYNKEI